MATDLRALLDNLRLAYDFRDKSVIHVGAGGSRVLDYATAARSVLAVDADPEGVRHLGIALRERDLLGRFILFRGDFGAVRARADVVFFEFCLHAMADPEGALRHARSLAPETLVVESAPGSRWDWTLGQDAEVARAWDAVGRLPIARDDTFMGAEQFHDYAELLGAVQTRGATAVGRIEDMKGREGIAIPMPYRIALLR